MRRIIRADKPLVREVWTREQVRAFFEKQGETFKAEWVMELPEDETITMYRSGGWLDLCRGPHLASTGKLDPDAFKLTRVSGAYWRGDQNNPQLSRIYGTGWLNRKQLDAHLVRLEEAAKRDHRKIGQEMDLFHLQAEAHGSVFWHPKGYVLWRQLEAYLRRRLDAAGYDEVKTPQLMDARQWEAIRPLGQISREHVRRPRRGARHRGGRADPVRRGRSDGAEADELPGPHPDLPPGHQILSRPADPPRRVRLLPPERAARRAARHPARAPVHPGRRPHLLPRGPDRRGDARCSATCSTRSTSDLGFADYAIKLALRPEQALRHATRCGTGPSRICATPSASPAATGPNMAGRSCRARAPSTRPSSNST